MLRQVHEYSGFPGRKVKVSIRERVCVKTLLLYLFHSYLCHIIIHAFVSSLQLPGNALRHFSAKGPLWEGWGVAGCFSGRETSKPHTQTAGLIDSMFGGVFALLSNWACNGTFCFQSNRITYNWE